MNTRASPVVIRFPDGTVMTKPPYSLEELTRIVAEGEDRWAQLYATGQAPDLKGTGYVPDSYDESRDRRGADNA